MAISAGPEQDAEENTVAEQIGEAEKAESVIENAHLVEDVTKVTVYSNLPEVELFAGGVSLGMKTVENHFFYFDVTNSGETKLEAVAGACGMKVSSVGSRR